MDYKEMYGVSKRWHLTMWGKIDGVWRWIIDITGDIATISDWKLPSEIGNTREVNIGEFSEFDLSA